MPRILAFRLLIGLLLLSLFGCARAAPSAPPTLIYRDWEGAMPQTVLDAFTRETGIPVEYRTYATQEEVLEEMRAGARFDVVVLESELVPGALREGLLMELHLRHISNFKNISPNFRDMAYDPRNAHSIPYSYGATGLVVRADLAERAVTRWSDLWAHEFAGRVITRSTPRYMIAIALKSLGFSANSEDPAELEAAKQHLIALQRRARQIDWEGGSAAPYLISGEAVMAVGEVDDMVAGEEAGQPFTFVLPEEGAILWGDNWTIPANSPNQEAAEQLINFFLRPEISAEITNTTYYWLPNDAALPLVDPAVRDNPAVMPAESLLRGAEILTGLSPAGEAAYQALWAAVEEGGGQ